MNEFAYSTKIMGTELDVSIISEHAPIQDYQKIEALFQRYEATYSRFKEESELSLLNKNKKIIATAEWFQILDEAERLGWRK